MKLMHMFAVAALLASSHLAFGQDETPVMTVNVPFAFSAGRYVISRLQEGQLWKLETFGHIGGIYLKVTPRELRRAAAASTLVFDHDETGYTLRQIQKKAETDVVQVVEPSSSKARKSTAQDVASVRALAQ